MYDRRENINFCTYTYQCDIASTLSHVFDFFLTVMYWENEQDWETREKKMVSKTHQFPWALEVEEAMIFLYESIVSVVGEVYCTSLH